jgi:hypothetical protein
MAEGHGGMRRPSNPAPVSGPGALSRRTDGQGARYIAGGEYGEGQEMMDLQTSAPMSKAPAAPRPRTGRQVVSEEMAPPTPLFAPTERPDEPITAGAPFGPGPGPTARTPMSSLAGTLEKLLPYDDDGSIRRLYATAVRRGW